MVSAWAAMWITWDRRHNCHYLGQRRVENPQWVQGGEFPAVDGVKIRVPPGPRGGPAKLVQRTKKPRCQF